MRGLIDWLRSLVRGKKRDSVYGYEYDRMVSVKDKGMPSGHYHFVLVRDNKIIAFGEEQGSYCGGIFASNDTSYLYFYGYKDWLRKNIPELYAKVAHIPIAGRDEYKRKY